MALCFRHLLERVDYLCGHSVELLLIVTHPWGAGVRIIQGGQRQRSRDWEAAVSSILNSAGCWKEVMDGIVQERLFVAAFVPFLKLTIKFAACQCSLPLCPPAPTSTSVPPFELHHARLPRVRICALSRRIASSIVPVLDQ